ncbi:flagellar basal-body MS-ring/collar protein FliF [Derxia lacustris]|uniref:flagellar basal-body MS-ring/collar protein FliF n=1 Tax=Derxia lacustris TaxID=764842 RepID=UPI000A173E90|nr:flagellar basal-body MS-ring/collar protein FliF [Derxia lacustris]
MADSLVATADDAPELPAPPQTPLERLRAAPPKTKMMLGGGAAALLALAVAAMLWNRPPDYAVLYSNLMDKDGGAVVAALSQMNVPYRTESGGVILVPRDKVADLRMRMASQGIVHGGNIGFELMDGQKLGATQFQEQMSYQRALAGELERSIQTVTGVQSARVLIAIPKPSVFVREDLKPTASVMVTLMPGRMLDETQVAGIAGLVSSAVPELSPRNVKIVDQTGKVLLRPEDNTSGLNRNQLEYVNRVEEQTIKRINDILEPIVGPENFRVQVTADVDFNQQEQTAETFKPNQDPKEGTVRSVQTVDAQSRQTTDGGVPGSLTNQPAAATTAPVGQGANPQAAQNASGPNAGPSDSRKESTINYEVDKQTRVTRVATGAIRRLTTAVVLNHRTLKNPPEGVPATQPLTAQELEQINALVREAMGFNKERGDSLSVSNVPFSLPDVPVAPDVPIWKDPATLALLKDLAPYLALLGIALIVVFGMVRPAIRSLNPPPPEEKDEEVPVPLALNADGTPVVPGGFEAVVGPDGEEIEALPPPPPKPIPDPKLIEDICVVARNDPKAVANVIKKWMNRDS